MCNPMSGVLTKDRAFWSMKTDHHSEIIKEHNLCESIGNHSAATCKVLIMKFELLPPDGDMTAPLSKWQYHEDQDIFPDWYDSKVCEKRARVALKEWHKARVITKDQASPLTDGKFWVYGCTVKAYGNSTVKAYDNSTVKAYGNSTVKAYGNSTVKAYGNSTVEAYGNSTVKAYGNSTVKAYGNSTVKAYGNSTVEAFGNSTVKAFGDSTVKAFGNITVKAYGNSTVKAFGNSTVKAFGNSTVDAFDNSTVKAFGNSTVYTIGGRCDKLTGNAVHIDRWRTPPVVHCGWVKSK